MRLWVFYPVTQKLLGAGCGESRTSGFEGEVRPSNADIDSNQVQTQLPPPIRRLGVSNLQRSRSVQVY